MSKGAQSSDFAAEFQLQNVTADITIFLSHGLHSIVSKCQY